MNTSPCWSDSKPSRKFPALGRNLRVDVVVVGGGITGATAAYLLKQAGATVALLERDRCISAETAHTTAHLTYVTDRRLSELAKELGRDHAQATWDAGSAAIDKIKEIIDHGAIRCEFAWVPGYLHVPKGAKVDLESERSRLQQDADLARELGFEAQYQESVPFLQIPGIRFANQAKFHPALYVASLLKTIPGKGSYVFENTELTQIEGDPPIVKAAGHTIHCRFVVVATHVPLQGAAGTISAALFQTKIAPYSTYAIGAKVPSGAAPIASFWDTADPYFYLRVDRKKGHDFAILGGADHKTGQVRDTSAPYARVEKQLRKLFPQAEVTHRWSGQVIETNDGLPFIGETAPKQFVATGFSGNGMTLATVAAMMACDAFVGRPNPWAELFRVDRKPALACVWDYLKENKDYPFYMVKQALSRPQANSTRSVKRGEGRIILLDDEKVAAFRDEKGKLTLKSAICTHMGCVIRWNGTEKTWDCPCHGSRFTSSGDVISGPAETPLPDAGA